ncbi:class I adenylate-forming enzyme family protein [Natrialbaceae archaeon GCM10025810]|uniref:class I adenylate-forming enzyme family protein n=1 Tax=Halovalidus salilacus TaxID=3075124 RepID=UPI00362018C5
MRETVDWPARDLVSHRAATTPDRPALLEVGAESGFGIDADTGPVADTESDGEWTWTYREYDRRVDRVAAALQGTGLRGKRIGVLMGTRAAFATVFFAAMRLGAVVVPLNVRETEPELAAKVERTEVSRIVCERDTESLALDLLDREEPVFSVDDPASTRASRLPGAETTVDAGGAETVEPAPLERDDTQLILFTSGTSGDPKGVRLTVGNLVASATASAFRLGVDPADRWLCCLPMYHMGGLAPAIRSALYGTTLVIQREFGPDSTARALAERDVTGVSLVPTMCKRLLDAGWEPADTLRFVLLGGAPASEELLERCLESGVPVHPTYGMTETASQIATATPAEIVAPERRATVGTPLSFTDVAVVDEAGDPVPAGEPGELVVSGPTVTPGYLEDPHADTAFGERGLHTGDIGYRDESGRLWVLNRRDDRIVTGGENVDPGEVVAALRAHLAIEEAAVVGLEDPEWGQRVAALLVPSDPETRPPLEEILGHCDERLAGFKRPKTIGFARLLPRTASGTVDREAVRERLLADGVDATN